MDEKDDDLLRAVNADGERHLDIGGAGWTCDERGVSGVTRRRERFGQIPDELAGAQNDEVDFGQERGLERLTLVEQNDRPRVRNARRAARQPELDRGVWFADGGEFSRKSLRANFIHKHSRRAALAEKVG